MGYGGQQTQSIDIHQRAWQPMFMEDSDAWKRDQSMRGGWNTKPHVDQFIGCVGRECSSWWSLASEPEQMIVGCDVDRVDSSDDRNDSVVPCSSVVEWKLHHLSSSLIRWATTRMCSSSVNSRSMGGSSFGVSILDRSHRLDWMVGDLFIYRSMKMKTYSSLTSITTELLCCILDGLMFKYSWTEINNRSN